MQNSKRAELVRVMYEQSHRDYHRSGVCVIVCLSWAVNHYRDNAITYKAQRDKNARELKLAGGAAVLTCRCVSVMLLRSLQILKNLADAKLKNDALRDDVAAGGRRLHIKAVCQSMREIPISAWIMQHHARLANLPLNGIISPSEEVDPPVQKQLEGTQKYINEQCR